MEQKEQNSKLANFFDAEKKKAKKKKKKTGATSGNEAFKVEAEVDDKKTENPLLQGDNAEDFEDPDEENTSPGDLLQGNTSIKDMTEVERARKAQEEKDDNKEWGFMKSQEPVAQKEAVAKQPRKNAADITFSRGKPTFQRANNKAIVKEEFPEMGEFPTLGAKGKPDKGAPAKSESAQIGSMGASAKDPREEKKTPSSGITFGAKPMFTRTKKEKVEGAEGAQEANLGKQNYDFDKMQRSAVAQKRVEGEGQ